MRVCALKSPAFRDYGTAVNVNCTDVANMACIFGNALGVGSSIIKIECGITNGSTGTVVLFNYLLNYIKAIGCNWTNNPFNRNPRSGFGFHRVASIGDNIYDPCLMVDDDSDPTQPPHTALLPKGMSYIQYTSKLIDPGNVDYNIRTNEQPYQVVDD